MPYRFKINEPVEKGFRRIAREQLEAAQAALAAPQVLPQGVHECRKAVKRLRALVRLASSALGPRVTRRRIKALGRAARALSARRDQAVMLETVAKLAADAGPDTAAILTPLRAYLVGQLGEQPHPLDFESAAKAQRLLARETKKFAHTHFRQRGFAALEKGLEKSYRKARQAMRNAYGEPTDEAFHALRKTVQWHWRQMSLLARAWPDKFAVRVLAARELSQMLGDDHDLAMLIAAAVKADDISADDKEAIVALCLARQRALRLAAEPRAERLFAETPKAFAKRMAVYWHLGRALDQGLDVVPVVTTGRQKPPAPVKSEIQPVAEPAKAASAKPRLASKAPASAPSQRRA
jgi:CHAD domain-containing protein